MRHVELKLGNFRNLFSFLRKTVGLLQVYYLKAFDELDEVMFLRMNPFALPVCEI